MQSTNFFDVYFDLVEPDITNYKSIEIHSVRDQNHDLSIDETDCFIDDENPQFYSIYARHNDGTCLVCADAGLARIGDLCHAGKNFALKHALEYRDFTDTGDMPNTENSQYHVHIYPVVRVKVANVQAENHAEAIKKAETMVDLHQMFLGSGFESADDIDCFLVDDVGDEEFANSRWYGKDGVTPLAWESNVPQRIPDKPVLKLITLSSGDCGLFLNDRNIMTADPQFEPVDQVETAGFNLANILACEISVINMKTPAKDNWNWNDVLMLHLNPDLSLYRVLCHDETGDKTTLHFDCFATDSEHAMEQAENAYPGCEILHAVLFEETDSCLITMLTALTSCKAS